MLLWVKFLNGHVFFVTARLWWCLQKFSQHQIDKKRLDGLTTHPGTTYSCVATYEGTNVEIIANEQGSFTTPSFVSFTDKERLIGDAAKNNAAMNPKNTVFDAK